MIRSYIHRKNGPRVKTPISGSTPLPGNTVAVKRDSADYGTAFWFTYIANFCISVGVAILYRYADLVVSLGGSELDLGWIVGVGMIGSLFMRLALGTGIDRNGPRLIWMGSALIYSISCFAHLLLDTCHGPSIYILRICFASAVAGVFGSAMAMISGKMKESRIAEILGMLGTSGFLGMVIGTQLGDIMVGGDAIERWQVDRVFVLAGLLGLVSLIFIWAATIGRKPNKRKRRIPIWAVLRRYHPGSVLWVSVVMGIALGMPATFLRTYAAELHIHRIAVFFSVYAPAGFITRVLTRHMPERFGTTNMTMVGLGGLAVTQFLFLGIESEWGFLLPGILFGASHAIVFPCVVAAGSSQFPERYRGLATMIMLSTSDIGVLIGAPLTGLILYTAAQLDLPKYPSIFCLTALLLLVTMAFHAIYSYRREQIKLQVRKTGPRRIVLHHSHRPTWQKYGETSPEIAVPDPILCENNPCGSLRE